jgi:hypothetical protein
MRLVLRRAPVHRRDAFEIGSVGDAVVYRFCVAERGTIVVLSVLSKCLARRSREPECRGVMRCM